MMKKLLLFGLRTYALCGFTVHFWLNYRNDGCWAFDGEAYLVLEDLVTFVSSTPEPTNTVGDTLFWSFGTLAPGASESVELMMTIAGVEFIGSTMEIATGIVPNDSNGQALEATTFDFYSMINCAYDPNDKQVYPNRSEQPPFTENYTLFNETLLYILRFQNPVHLYAEAGTYTVCLTAANDWGSTQYCEEITVITTSTDAALDYSRIQIHPNPAQNTVWIDSSTRSYPQRLTLYSAAGQLLQSIILEKATTAWDISFLTAGSYWVRTEAGAVLPLVVVK